MGTSRTESCEGCPKTQLNFSAQIESSWTRYDSVYDLSLFG